MKKSIKRTVTVILIVIASLLVIAAAGIGILAANRLTPAVGTYIAANGGTDMIFTDNSPCIMSNRTGNENVFGGLQTGDKILIVTTTDRILPYPGQVDCYFCLRLGGGSLTDVPENHLEQLRDMGWLPSTN
ncbi:MAG: hypothetical protein NC299_06525 [Lachnospiraceae bacterium]|nr:hypothetical protein [Ruminococcus sp.]MCM1275009.1 hypothetical protein [Lachnospiraceae bacterium]